MAELDRSKPFCTVSGDSRARYYQGGVYFAPNGKEISAEDAGKPAEGGPTEQEVHDARVKASEFTDEELDVMVASKDPEKQSQATSLKQVKEARKEKKAEVAKIKAPPEEAEITREDMATLETKVLNNMVAEAGGDKFSGPNAKAKAIEFLMTHVAGVSKA